MSIIDFHPGDLLKQEHNYFSPTLFRVVNYGTDSGVFKKKTFFFNGAEVECSIEWWVLQELKGPIDNLQARQGNITLFIALQFVDPIKATEIFGTLVHHTNYINYSNFINHNEEYTTIDLCIFGIYAALPNVESTFKYSSSSGHRIAKRRFGNYTTTPVYKDIPHVKTTVKEELAQQERKQREKDEYEHSLILRRENLASTLRTLASEGKTQDLQSELWWYLKDRYDNVWKL